MTIATLFSGIGTPEIAIKQANIKHKIAFGCEIDKYARQTYLSNHNIEKEDFYEDISSFDASKYKGKVDILVFGSPCQPFSIRGYRQGFNDPRGKLFFDGIDRISECQPRVVIFENVLGLLSHDKGNTFEIVKQSFHDIGYMVKHKILKSVELGSLQKRERLFLVAFLNSEDYDRFDFNDLKKEESELFLEDILEDEVEQKYWLSGAAKTYMSELYKESSRIKKGLMLKNRWEHLTPNNTSNKFAYTITASYSRGYPHNVLINEKGCKYGFWSCDHACSDMCESCDIENSLNYDDNNIATPACRKLTPRECARLQNIPDSFTFPISDTQKYKQIGNSMDVNVVKKLIEYISNSIDLILHTP